MIGDIRAGMDIARDMNMKAHRQKILPHWLIGLILLSCVSDPWPEPDDAEHKDGEPDDPTEAGDSKNDGGSDGINGSDSDATSGEDSGSELGPQVDDKDSESSGLLEDLIFISTPGNSGDATVVGLAGAVPPDSTLLITSDDYAEVIPVSREGGFAVRVPDVRSQSDIRLVLVDGVSDVSLIEMMLANDMSDVSWVTLIPGTMEAPIGSVVGDGKGVTRLSESLIEIRGEGEQLDGGYLVVAANLTGHVGALAPVICFEDVCKFSLIIPAGSGDEVDLFLVPDTVNQDVHDVRFGTVSETIIVD